MAPRMYSTVIDGNTIKADSNELASYIKSYIRSAELLERISEIFIFDTFVLDRFYGVDPHDVFNIIGNLETGVVTGVKPATQFRNIPLKGLWHQHYFSAMFVLNNIRIGLGKKGIGGLVEEIFNRDGSPVITQEMINELSHRVVHDPLNKRNEDDKLTGEWIIFIRHDSKRYYLCLSVHDAEDQSIYDKIVHHCSRDFPDLATWIQEARGSM